MYKGLYTAKAMGLGQSEALKQNLINWHLHHVLLFHGKLQAGNSPRKATLEGLHYPPIFKNHSHSTHI